MGSSSSSSDSKRVFDFRPGATGRGDVRSAVGLESLRFFAALRTGISSTSLLERVTISRRGADVEGRFFGTGGIRTSTVGRIFAFRSFEEVGASVPVLGDPSVDGCSVSAAGFGGRTRGRGRGRFFGLSGYSEEPDVRVSTISDRIGCAIEGVVTDEMREVGGCGGAVKSEMDETFSLD